MPRVSLTAKAIRYTISGVLAAGLLAGCAGSASKQLARAGDHAERSAARHGSAIAAAEQAVALSPDDAAARAALGQAYLDAGRFQSAATTFGDAITLGDAAGGTQLRLALAQIGAGDNRSAVAVLDEARDSVPVSDRGLALALAGDTGRGIAILLDAVRGGENSPKLRQNLAFAFALDGRWREARMAMAQDVPADQVDDRISEWAMMSGPEFVQRRIATLLGVPAGVQDPGQPQMLALGAAPAGEQLAAADPVAPAPSGELPAIDQAPAVAAAPVVVEPASSFAGAFDTPQPATAAGQPGFVAQPVVQSARAQATNKPEARPTAVAASGGTHLVQLGSFSSEANARRAWRVYTARNPQLRNFRMTITPAVVNGKDYWRVAAAGLDAGTALRLCSGLKNRGRGCFAYAADRTLPGVAKPALALGGAGAKVRR